jgi:hypothetical protein
VTVTYNDGSTAATPGTYVPAGSPPPTQQAPAQTPTGVGFPPPDSQFQVPLATNLVNAPWNSTFLLGVCRSSSMARLNPRRSC